MNDNSYDYEYYDNGDYCYPKTNVLRNKFNIRDEVKLREVERKFSMARYFELEKHGITDDFSLDHLCNIHHYLFQDIYDWAGKLRTVDIAKGTIFCLVQFIEPQFEVIHKWLLDNRFLKDISDIEEMSVKTAYLLGEINMIHPFREGNGRTQRMYIEQICVNNGLFRVNYAHTAKDEMIIASHETARCRYQLMENVMRKCLVEA